MVASAAGEKRIGLGELAAKAGVHISTVHAWYRRGVRGVKLSTFMVGGRRFTNATAVDEFQKAVTAAANRELLGDAGRGKAVACHA